MQVNLHEIGNDPPLPISTGKVCAFIEFILCYCRNMVMLASIDGTRLHILYCIYIFRSTDHQTIMALHTVPPPPQPPTNKLVYKDFLTRVIRSLHVPQLIFFIVFHLRLENISYMNLYACFYFFIGPVVVFIFFLIYDELNLPLILKSMQMNR